MANRYVYSGAAGAGTGADWANAHTTLTAAITAGAAGDTYYLAHDHAQSSASAVTLAFKGTVAAPDRILSVNRAGSVPPVAADLLPGATITTTGTSAINVQNSTDAYYYVYGVTFHSGSGGSTNASINVAPTGGFAGRQVFEACHFRIGTTSTAARLILGGTSGCLEFINCTCQFGSTSQGLNLSATSGFVWRGNSASSLLSGATVPTTFVVAGNTSSVLEPCVFSGVDLSAFGSGKTLVGASTTEIRLINCKLDASVTVSAVPPTPNGRGNTVIGSGSTTNVARSEWYQYGGNLTTETTIKRTGGASDGVTTYSWKIVSNANNREEWPVQTFEGSIWNDDTGSSKTLTVHTVTDNVTLTDAEIWLEVEYLGSSATPVATLITDRRATVLSTAANQASSSETWTTTGLSTPVKQQLEVTFTPEMAGPIRWRVKYAKASSTVYVCPKAELS